MPVSEVEEKPLTWLWENHIPAGSLVSLIGDGGLGKSLITLDLAARVTTGDAMPDGSAGVAPGGVILFANEDSATVIKRRLRESGADLTQVHLADDDDHAWEFPQDARRLERDIIRADVRLVVLDPVMDYMPDVKDRQNKSVRDGLLPLRRIAERTGATVVLVRHINKSAGPASMRGSGSTAWRNVPRAEYVVAPDPDDPDRALFAYGKSNLFQRFQTRAYAVRSVAPMVAVIDWDGLSPYTADEALSPSARVARPREDAAAFLRTVLMNGPLPTMTVQADAQALGISERTLNRARKELGVKPTKTPTGWVLELPKEVSAP